MKCFFFFEGTVAPSSSNAAPPNSFEAQRAISHFIVFRSREREEFTREIIRDARRDEIKRSRDLKQRLHICCRGGRTSKTNYLQNEATTSNGENAARRRQSAAARDLQRLIKSRDGDAVIANASSWSANNAHLAPRLEPRLRHEELVVVKRR